MKSGKVGGKVSGKVRAVRFLQSFILLSDDGSGLE